VVQVAEKKDEKRERKPETAPRREHFMYVSAVSLSIWAGLGLALACVFPSYNVALHDELDKFYIRCFFNRSLLWYLSGGIFFGALIGIVLNRMVLVANAKRGEQIVRLSRISRIGRFLAFGGGLPIWGILAVLYALFTMAQPFVFSATPLGFVPGLSVLQSKPVKMWTAKYLAENPDPDAIGALIKVLKRDDDRHVKYCCILALEGAGDVRSVEAIADTLRGDENFWIRVKAAKALGRIGNAAAVRALESAAKTDINVQVSDLSKDIVREIRATGKWIDRSNPWLD
jgi:hypothetical protein